MRWRARVAAEVAAAVPAPAARAPVPAPAEAQPAGDEAHEFVLREEVCTIFGSKNSPYQSLWDNVDLPERKRGEKGRGQPHVHGLKPAKTLTMVDLRISITEFRALGRGAFLYRGLQYRQ